MIRVFRDWFLDQLAMYAAYHKDRRNQLTHYVGVPIIIFSILTVLIQVPPAGPVSAAGAFLGIILLSYVVAVPLIGVLSAVACLPLYVLAAGVAEMEPAPRWSVAAACFAGGWAIQFVGHIFEGRKPAFLSNALQLFMAPAFLIAELMFAAGLQRSLADLLHVRARKYARP
ncbi:MAG: DUF962 domain-containing protein [Rhodospirillaceae bacterium]